MEYLFVAVFLGFIPAIIAKSKGRSFFGWYVYGVALFIIAFFHALFVPSLKKEIITQNGELITPETHMICPDCKEYVRIAAKKCRHCGCLFLE